MRSLKQALAEHLAWWGLRRFDSDAAYYQWQREMLSPSDLGSLHKLLEKKRTPGAGASEEAAFYDAAARPEILPVLYSQRYDLYMAVGPLVVERIRGARSVLDFGCGVGILTTFYAKQYPDIRFLGIDRSAASVAAAQERASKLGLRNLRFECLDIERTAPPSAYDLIISTHALLQAEGERGIPSASWQTFERPFSELQQRTFEDGTGLSARLDGLAAALAPHGRMLVFEKTRQLARRIPFQRALAARGFSLAERPIPVRYLLVEEITDDGPLYSLVRGSGPTLGKETIQWDETPESSEEDDLYVCRGRTAETVWARLPARAVTRAIAWQEPGVGRIQAEIGRASLFFAYLYLHAGQGLSGLLVGQPGGVLERIGENPHEIKALVQRIPVSSASQDDPADVPLYENHTIVAQQIWASLPERRVIQSRTFEEPDGRQAHIELGETSELRYVYWADTFDQRQVVIMEQSRASALEQYYHELVADREIEIPERRVGPA